VSWLVRAISLDASASPITTASRISNDMQPKFSQPGRDG
jgi:hypothetical protein